MYSNQMTLCVCTLGGELYIGLYTDYWENDGALCRLNNQTYTRTERDDRQQLNGWWLLQEWHFSLRAKWTQVDVVYAITNPIFLVVIVANLFFWQILNLWAQQSYLTTMTGMMIKFISSSLSWRWMLRELRRLCILMLAECVRWEC